MAIQTRYDGVWSSDLADAQTTDGVLIVDLWRQANTFVDEYNRIKNTMLQFMGYETTRAEADIVRQANVKWQRFSEWGKPDVRSRLEYDIAVTTGLEGFQTAIEWTDFAELLGIPAQMITTYVSGVVEGDLNRTNQQLWEQFFDNVSRTVEDIKLKKAVTQLPFYNGDARVPPKAGTKTFSGTHNHYLRTATSGAIVAADLDTLVNTVTEHGFNSDIYIFGSQATVDMIMAITGDVIAKIQVMNRFIPTDAVNANQPGALVSTFVQVNPMFAVTGSFKGKANIAIVRDAPDGYIGCFSHEGPLSPANPLQIRLPEEPALRTLRRAGDRQYPFVGEYWQRLMGISTRQFGNGAAMQHTWSSGSAYQVPTWTYDVY